MSRISLHLIHTAIHLSLADDVTVGHKVMLHGCTIGNRVLVGMGSILLDGVIVEDDIMIGAGSLVPQNKRLKSGYLYFGNPVKTDTPPDRGGNCRATIFSEQLCKVER
ncbi:carbonic anhydrase [Klebsiella michiganensis]|uniref:Carbonic anhydrase n=1 Tax=Klebsiella michiganensis TaxID=1134687 RepID=A0A7H4PGU3_9ENTR|nr:carbonic anhydrase [Klebsiella michiganensis]